MANSKPRQYLLRIDARHAPARAGNKAVNLHRLIQKGVRVPTSYAVSWDAYDHYLQNHIPMIEALRQQLGRLLDPEKAYAVRSSANIEDTLEHSFAGQFKTVLGVRDELSVLQAIWSIWAMANSPGVQTYLKKLPLQQQELHMAVILQEMVTPLVSGVSFSRNPLTGEDEVIVEAVQGAGTALVQQGTTPLHWVHQAGRWKTCPQNTPIETSLIEEVVLKTRQIAAAFKYEVDLEWVYDGQVLYFVQMREITSLKNVVIYSNRIAKEVLPGMIKPLVWSINIPLVNTVWVDLLTELVGKNDLKVDDLAKSFYYRTYFNLSALGRIWEVLQMPRESLEMMMGILPRSEGQRIFKPTWRMIRLEPRLLIFLHNKWTLGQRFEKDFPHLSAIFQDYDWQSAHQCSETELLAVIDRLYDDVQKLVYYNINIPILMALYNALFGRFLKKAGVDPARFDLMAGMTEYLEHAPDVHIKKLHQDYARLDPDIKKEILQSSYNEFRNLPGISNFQQAFTEFLQRFDHLSDSGNDFSAVPWREKPETVLKLVTQQAPAGDSATRMVVFEELSLAIFAKPLASLLYSRARQFRLHREQISSLYTFAYGLFRPYFLALGWHFTARGLLSDPTDIFYLNRSEIREIVITSVEDHSMPIAKLQQDISSLASSRKTEMMNCQDVLLPTLIYGDVAPIVNTNFAEKLFGVPTSRGYYSGPIKVVSGLDDFSRVLPGDVIVIPYSDVGWSPLFARAGAVIAESGGMLSHSSIVAREYRIPAVVSVPGAMRLPDQMFVTVDGYRGEITLHKPER